MTHWETPIVKLRILLIVGVAVTMTLAAELIYFTVWGLWLFPEGNLISKITWTMTCGVAMGAVIALATLILVEGNLQDAKAILAAAGIVALVGTFCAILYSQIDHSFNYFGGKTHTLMFILSGVIPAIVGGILYGWVLYSSRFFDSLTDPQIADR